MFRRVRQMALEAGKLLPTIAGLLKYDQNRAQFAFISFRLISRYADLYPRFFAYSDKQPLVRNTQNIYSLGPTRGSRLAIALSTEDVMTGGFLIPKLRCSAGQVR